MSKATVLLVDDCEIDRYLAKRILSASDYVETVVELSDGTDLVRLVNSPVEFEAACGQPPPAALIFLDINMPGMNGLEVLEQSERLRAVGEFETDGACTVVMLTSSSFHEDRDRAKSFDFVTEYIEKPITRENLDELIDQRYPELKVG